MLRECWSLKKKKKRVKAGASKRRRKRVKAGSLKKKKTCESSLSSTPTSLLRI